ncbi:MULTISPECIES: (2Fe-2S)-binding protein [Bacillus]|uniref:(2Fe-2S)-binding protein n=1 Tax=Bacillus TaxID=1386 RepID=UPI00032F4C8C|nr:MULTISPECIES: (2Fe-2S)-binding protein [Bacillus cereus group]EOP54825.1 xanthine dehydrogenase iron-sulfur subunit [Bacillus cereus VD136]EOP72883.1 xanthine dehydrogenase iron-sulfur subunit [Bacillus cereus VDM006]EOQ10539.1 xanthine dehydrogenase iron-sulfur subunit [Bacillus cereus VDM021]OOG90803.1 Xanthine dehydrogenase iron-sulfur subunit [Bacillus mycoides]MDF2085935.1 (2Fe-2S)-binding protein [Bacillus pseudomycoides]
MGKGQLSLHVNGEDREVVVRMGDTLLYTLRHRLGLTGAKPGCENGDCGACTVLVEGIPIKSCIILAVEAIGKQIITVEGLQETPIQKAFEDKWAFQCGYCTPGFIINCHALVTQKMDVDDLVIEEWLSSNICRCTSYQEIEEAVKSILQKQRENQ